jgi:hypothetical protein
MRQPGTIERAFGGAAAPGLGSTFLTILAASFIGTSIAQAFFAGDGGAGPDSGDSGEAGDYADSSGYADDGGDYGGDGGDFGGDFGGGDFGGDLGGF